MKKSYLKLVVAIVFSSNLFAQNIPSYVSKDGLVGWWPFNGNANDESGNGNHGTVNGATLTTDRNGKANSSYSFDGLSNKIEVMSNQSFDIKQLSISLWINSPNNKVQKLVSRTNWNSSNENFSLCNDQNNTYLVLKKNSNCIPGKGLIPLTSNTNSKYSNKWSHLVTTYNGDKVLLNKSFASQHGVSII